MYSCSLLCQLPTDLSEVLIGLWMAWAWIYNKWMCNLFTLKWLLKVHIDIVNCFSWWGSDWSVRICKLMMWREVNHWLLFLFCFIFRICSKLLCANLYLSINLCVEKYFFISHHILDMIARVTNIKQIILLMRVKVRETIYVKIIFICFLLFTCGPLSS